MTKTKLTAYLAATLLIGWLGAPIGGAETRKLAVAGQPGETLVLDVAMDAGTMAFSRPDAVATGPQRGDSYVMSGFVYAGGSIPDGDTTYSFAPDPDTSIGTITANGIFTTDGASIAAGTTPFATSTHSVSLYSADGLVSQGPEGSDTQFRALLGGVGIYAGAVGQITQQVLGSNGTGGPNLRLTIQLLPLNPQDNSQTVVAAQLKAKKPKKTR